MLTRCLQSDDDRIAMMAAQAILDRGYGKPAQTIVPISPRTAGRSYYAELPKKAESPEAWLQSLGGVRLSRLGQGSPMTPKVTPRMSRGIRRSGIPP